MPTLILENSPTAEAGAGVGVNSLMRSMGTTVAGAVMAIVLTSQTVSMDEAQIPAEAAFRTCFIIGAGAALAGALVVLLIKRSKPEPHVVESPEHAASNA